MTSLHIQANLDANTLDMLTNLALKLDPNATITQDSSYQLSQNDESRLKETLELRKQGKLQYHSLKESKAISEQHLENLGAKL